MTVIRNGYLSRRTNSHKARGKTKAPYRNWWLPKYNKGFSKCLYVGLNTVIIPKEYAGKRLRFKVEVVED